MKNKIYEQQQQVYENNMYNNQNNYEKSNYNYSYNVDNKLCMCRDNRIKRKPLYKKLNLL